MQSELRKTWLLLDCNNLCHRAFHALKGLSRGDTEGIGAAMTYGFMRDLVSFRQQFGTDNFIFCFDHGINRRKALFPIYKANRVKTDPMMIRDKERVENQIQELKNKLLKRLGYVNVFFEDGFEADDLMASCLDSIPKDDLAILISGDHDLFQLLQKDSVSQWAPAQKVMFTEDWFRQEHTFSPYEWIKVKALAGCKSDNVPGVKGVGEQTAKEFITGELSKKFKVYPKIEEFLISDQYSTNLRLVTLPFEGCPQMRPKEQPKIDIGVWDDEMGRQGFPSLYGMRVSYV